MPPDSTQLVVGLVLTALAAVGILAYQKRFRSGGGWGETLLLAAAVLLLGSMFSWSGYLQADRNWNTLSGLVEGQRFESALVTFPDGETEPAKVRSIQRMLDEHAYESPRVVSLDEASVDGCEILVSILGCPVSTIWEVQQAFTDVYGCETTVIGVSGFGGAPSAPA